MTIYSLTRYYWVGIFFTLSGCNYLYLKSISPKRKRYDYNHHQHFQATGTRT